MYVKDNLGSSFEQTMMGPNPQCYIPRLVEIGLDWPVVIVVLFSLKIYVCFLSASLIQAHLFTMAHRELKPVKYLQLFKIFAPSF